jgi:hypothetical protein
MCPKRCSKFTSVTESSLTTDSHRVSASSGAVPSVDELVFALSSTSHVREPVPIQPLLTCTQKKHLNLLDGIALLLVTEDKADAAAVSSRLTPTSIEFFYAKNRPCTMSMKNYVESLLKEIKEYKPSRRGEFIENVLTKAASACTEKIRNRIRKISVELARFEIALETLNFGDGSNIGNIHVSHLTGKSEGKIANAVVNGYSRIKPAPEEMQPNLPDKILLAHYFGFVLRMDVPVEVLRNNIGNLVELMIISYDIGKISIFRFKNEKDQTCLTSTRQSTSKRLHGQRIPSSANSKAR